MVRIRGAVNEKKMLAVERPSSLHSPGHDPTDSARIISRENGTSSTAAPVCSSERLTSERLTSERLTSGLLQLTDQPLDSFLCPDDQATISGTPDQQLTKPPSPPPLPLVKSNQKAKSSLDKESTADELAPLNSVGKGEDDDLPLKSVPIDLKKSLAQVTELRRFYSPYLDQQTKYNHRLLWRDLPSLLELGRINHYLALANQCLEPVADQCQHYPIRVSDMSIECKYCHRYAYEGRFERLIEISLYPGLFGQQTSRLYNLLTITEYYTPPNYPLHPSTSCSYNDTSTIGKILNDLDGIYLLFASNQRPKLISTDVRVGPCVKWSCFLSTDPHFVDSAGQSAEESRDGNGDNEIHVKERVGKDESKYELKKPELTDLSGPGQLIDVHPFYYYYPRPLAPDRLAKSILNSDQHLLSEQSPRPMRVYGRVERSWIAMDSVSTNCRSQLDNGKAIVPQHELFSLTSANKYEQLTKKYGAKNVKTIINRQGKTLLSCHTGNIIASLNGQKVIKTKTQPLSKPEVTSNENSEVDESGDVDNDEEVEEVEELEEVSDDLILYTLLPLNDESGEEKSLVISSHFALIVVRASPEEIGEMTWSGYRLSEVEVRLRNYELVSVAELCPLSLRQWFLKEIISDQYSPANEGLIFYLTASEALNKGHFDSARVLGLEQFIHPLSNCLIDSQTVVVNKSLMSLGQGSSYIPFVSPDVDLSADPLTKAIQLWFRGCRRRYGLRGYEDSLCEEDEEKTSTDDSSEENNEDSVAQLFNQRIKSAEVVPDVRHFGVSTRELDSLRRDYGHDLVEWDEEQGIVHCLAAVFIFFTIHAETDKRTTDENGDYRVISDLIVLPGIHFRGHMQKMIEATSFLGKSETISDDRDSDSEEDNDQEPVDGNSSSRVKSTSSGGQRASSAANAFSGPNIPYLPLIDNSDQTADSPVSTVAAFPGPTSNLLTVYKAVKVKHERAKRGMVTAVIDLDDAKLVMPSYGNKMRTNRCRVTKIDAFVVDDGHWSLEKIDRAYSLHDHSFLWQVDQIVEEPNLDPNPNIPCSSGLHFWANPQDVFSMMGISSTMKKVDRLVEHVRPVPSYVAPRFIASTLEWPTNLNTEGLRQRRPSTHPLNEQSKSETVSEEDEKKLHPPPTPSTEMDEQDISSKTKQD